MRRTSQCALSTLCGLLTLDFLAIFGLIFTTQDPDTFNPIMTGFTYTMCGILGVGGVILAYEGCRPLKSPESRLVPADLEAELPPPYHLALEAQDFPLPPSPAAPPSYELETVKVDKVLNKPSI